MSRRHLSAALIAPAPEKAESWVAHLQANIDPNWREGEWDHGNLLFVPDVTNPHTQMTTCRKRDCWVRLAVGGICPSCRRALREAQERTPALTEAEWLNVPRRRTANPAAVEVSARQGLCGVPECPRQYQVLGLCNTHAASYRTYRATKSGASIAEWMSEKKRLGLPPLPSCSLDCGRDRVYKNGFCNEHYAKYRKWAAVAGKALSGEATQEYTRLVFEPWLDAATRTTYASVYATPFALLPEPLRWELLYAVQQRDKAGRSRLDPEDLRNAYLALRRSEITTVVGATEFALPRRDANFDAGLIEWQRLLDDAYRDWSGIDTRDPRVLHLQDLTLRESSRRIGPRATMDLRGIEQEWIWRTLAAWAKAAPRGGQDLLTKSRVWAAASEVLAVRGTPRQALGQADIDAVVKALRAQWPSEAAQGRAINSVRDVIKFGRLDENTHDLWRDIPARFAIDEVRHQTIIKPEHRKNPDEAFRFVPQPIMDWLMDHLHLIDRKSAYLTAEARAVIFVHERCGRRTGETLALKDDCLSYDDEGAPYLEWRRGKPPYTMGKRLPIHQETHDVIREWQRIKREHGVESQWLFPSRRYDRDDRTYQGKFLADRIAELIALVDAKAPFQGQVEGADGNLAYFDMTAIDPYSFRHAFAQRLADATDAEGRPTTPPDVLQEYMGHRNFNTTMAYYEVTAKRRKKALSAIAPRRISLTLDVVNVSPERAAFNKIAVTSGDCTEPQNVAAGGHSCMVEHACESCPFFLVDPLERDSMDAKRHHPRVKLERSRAIGARQHMLDHYAERIKDCNTIIDGIDSYVDALPATERDNVKEALEKMADIRKRATAPRRIDLRTILAESAQ